MHYAHSGRLFVVNTARL